ncbi:MAG: DUF4097 domain-containing protein [Bacteroidales bacterium]|nr:DUF4097 domain-containing protein [Bacteroidales bacterium]
MIPFIRKILFLLLVAGAFHCPVTAQDKIQVVTRSITKTLNQSEVEGLSIKGEKANIIIGKSASNVIRIKLSLVSKNPSRKTAEEDLRYCDYVMENRGNMLYLSNSFNLKSSYKEISSNLSARYEIEVPNGITVNLSNIYGDITLSGIKVNLTASLSFGQLFMKNVDGNIQIRSTFSDITGEMLNGPLKIDSQNTGIKLTQVNDVLEITGKFGEINLAEVNASVMVKSEMTKVTCSSPIRTIILLACWLKRIKFLLRPDL